MQSSALCFVYAEAHLIAVAAVCVSAVCWRGNPRAARNASQPHATGCRTDSEDACTSKSRGIMLREPKNTGKHQDAAKTPLCSATRRLRCEEEALVGDAPDLDLA